MLHNTQQKRPGGPGAGMWHGRKNEWKKQTNKQEKNSTIKSPHYIKIENDLEENIIPARKAKNTGENLYKTPCI